MTNVPQEYVDRLQQQAQSSDSAQRDAARQALEMVGAKADPYVDKSPGKTITPSSEKEAREVLAGIHAELAEKGDPGTPYKSRKEVERHVRMLERQPMAGKAFTEKIQSRIPEERRTSPKSTTKLEVPTDPYSRIPSPSIEWASPSVREAQRQQSVEKIQVAGISARRLFGLGTPSTKKDTTPFGEDTTFASSSMMGMVLPMPIPKLDPKPAPKPSSDMFMAPVSSDTSTPISPLPQGPFPTQATERAKQVAASAGYSGSMLIPPGEPVPKGTVFGESGRAYTPEHPQYYKVLANPSSDSTYDPEYDRSAISEDYVKNMGYAMTEVFTSGKAETPLFNIDEWEKRYDSLLAVTNAVNRGDPVELAYINQAAERGDLDLPLEIRQKALEAIRQGETWESPGNKSEFIKANIDTTVGTWETGQYLLPFWGSYKTGEEYGYKSPEFWTSVGADALLVAPAMGTVAKGVVTPSKLTTAASQTSAPGRLVRVAPQIEQMSRGQRILESGRGLFGKSSYTPKSPTTQGSFIKRIPSAVRDIEHSVAFPFMHPLETVKAPFRLATGGGVYAPQLAAEARAAGQMAVPTTGLRGQYEALESTTSSYLFPKTKTGEQMTSVPIKYVKEGGQTVVKPSWGAGTDISREFGFFPPKKITTPSRPLGEGPIGTTSRDRVLPGRVDWSKLEGPMSGRLPSIGGSRGPLDELLPKPKGAVPSYPRSPFHRTPSGESVVEEFFPKPLSPTEKLLPKPKYARDVSTVLPGDSYQRGPWGQSVPEELLPRPYSSIYPRGGGGAPSMLTMEATTPSFFSGITQPSRLPSLASPMFQSAKQVAPYLGFVGLAAVPGVAGVQGEAVSPSVSPTYMQSDLPAISQFEGGSVEQPSVYNMPSFESRVPSEAIDEVPMLAVSEAPSQVETPSLVRVAQVAQEDEIVQPTLQPTEVTQPTLQPIETTQPTIQPTEIGTEDVVQEPVQDPIVQETPATVPTTYDYSWYYNASPWQTPVTPGPTIFPPFLFPPIPGSVPGLGGSQAMGGGGRGRRKLGKWLFPELKVSFPNPFGSKRISQTVYKGGERAYGGRLVRV